MYLTTSQLIVLRLYNATLGRTAFFSRLLKNFLIKLLITSRNVNRYGASSAFYVPEQLDGE